MTNNNMSLQEVNHEQLIKHLHINLRAGCSAMIRGGVGIGKTYSVQEYAKQDAKRLKRHFLVWVDLPKEDRYALAHGQPIVRAGTDKDELYLKDVYILALFDTLNKLPEDTAGIPMPNNGFVEWKPPLLFWILSQPTAAGVLFLDEFLQAPQMVQKPLADVFLNKQISDSRLSDDVGIIAASNDKHDKCGTIEMLEHAKNRVGHYTLVPPSAADWVAYMRAQDEFDENGNVTKTRIDPRITMVIMSCPDQLYQPIGNRVEDAYPTPRSWDILSDLIKGVNHEKDKMLFLTLVASRVGSGAASKFQDVLNHDMSTHGPGILADPTLFKQAPWDRKVAFTMWVSGHSAGDKGRSMLKDTCKFLDTLGDDSMLDTILYMMQLTVGAAFVREISGTMKYPNARQALLSMAQNIGSISG